MKSGRAAAEFETHRKLYKRPAEQESGADPRRMVGARMSDKGLKDREVGYGRPPQRTRFQPGRSGNPRGRPKGSKTLSAALYDALGKRIPITEHGRTRMRRVRDVIVRGLVSDAARREPQALKLLFALHNRN